jgi:hypothetical protein
MVQKIKMIKADQVQPTQRTSPAALIIAAMKEQGEYYTMGEVAKMVGVHIETLRRLCRTDRIKALSEATQVGKMVIYAFTPEDIEEVKAYFDGKDQTQTAMEAKMHGKAKTDKVR